MAVKATGCSANATRLLVLAGFLCVPLTRKLPVSSVRTAMMSGSVAEQADDTEVVLGLEAEPLHGEARDPPGAQVLDLAQLPEAGRAHRRHARNGFEGRVENALGQFDGAFLREVPGGLDQVGLGLRAKVGWLQHESPRACFFNWAARLGVSAWLRAGKAHGVGAHAGEDPAGYQWLPSLGGLRAAPEVPLAATALGRQSALTNADCWAASGVFGQSVARPEAIEAVGPLGDRTGAMSR